MDVGGSQEALQGYFDERWQKTFEAQFQTVAAGVATPIPDDCRVAAALGESEERGMLGRFGRGGAELEIAGGDFFGSGRMEMESGAAGIEERASLGGVDEERGNPLSHGDGGIGMDSTDSTEFASREMAWSSLGCERA